MNDFLARRNKEFEEKFTVSWPSGREWSERETNGIVDKVLAFHTESLRLMALAVLEEAEKEMRNGWGDFMLYEGEEIKNVFQDFIFPRLSRLRSQITEGDLPKCSCEKCGDPLGEMTRTAACNYCPCHTPTPGEGT